MESNDLFIYLFILVGMSYFTLKIYNLHKHKSFVKLHLPNLFIMHYFSYLLPLFTLKSNLRTRNILNISLPVEIT